MGAELLANRFEIVGTLGEGAMGRVLRARDRVTSEEVALKVILPTLGDTEKSQLQFRQEFRLMTQLRHPNCCRVHDYGVLPDGAPFFTMEVVPGHGLDEVLPLAEDRVREVLGQLMLALGYVHGLGLVHRDIKSANVRVMPEGTVKLMDYGLVDYVGQSSDSITGTPAYLSPEVIRRGPVDGRADLYSAGVLAYELLTGRLPFVKATPLELIRAHVGEPPEPLERSVRGIAPDLSAVVMRLLAKDPGERFQSAFQVLEALGHEVPPTIGGRLLAPPMTGRDGDLAALVAMTSGVRFVVGLAGVGKSRLVDELRFQVQLAGHPFGSGAVPERGALPYAAFRGVLARLLPSLREHCTSELARLAPVLVELLPELGAPAAAPLDTPDKEKLRLQLAVVEVLTALARAQQVVLVIEDWQWADTLSVELLGRLTAALSEVPLAVIVTARPGAPLPPEADVLDLTPLDEAETRRFIEATLGTPEVEEAFATRVHAHAGGNPLFTARLLEHLVAVGTLAARDTGWDTRCTWDAGDLPLGVSGILSRQFERLSPDERRALEAAAVLEKGFDLPLLQATSGLPDEALFGAVEALLRGRVLQQDRQGRFSFVHAEVALAASELPSDEVRQGLHTAALAALAAPVADPASLPLDRLTALARHARGARAHADAARFARLAGAALERLFANEDALGWLEVAQAALAALPDDHPMERLDCLEARGNILRLTGGAAEAERAYREALELAEAVGLPEARKGSLEVSLGKCLQLQSRLQEAVAVYEAGGARCLAAGDLGGAARARLSAGRVRLFEGDRDQALAEVRASLALARHSRMRVRLADALTLLGYLEVEAGGAGLSLGLEHLYEGLALLQDAQDPIGENNAHNLIGNALNVMGRPAEARPHFLDTQRIAGMAQLREELALSSINLSLCAQAQGDFLEAGRWVEAAREQHGEAPLVHTLTLALAPACEVPLGRFDRLDELAEAVRLARSRQHAYIETIAQQHRLIALLRLGVPADDVLMELQGLPAPDHGEQAAQRLALAGRVALAAGRLAEARSELDQALSLAVEAGAGRVEVEVRLARGGLATAEERWEEATTDVTAGATLAEERGLRYLRAELRLLEGELALAHGRTEVAAGHFAVAADEAEQGGYRLLLPHAWFGLAAAWPYAAEAGGRVQRAVSMLEDLAAALPEALREAFLAVPARQRVLQRNHVAFGLPRVRAQAPRPSMPPGLRNL